MTSSSDLCHIEKRVQTIIKALSLKGSGRMDKEVGYGFKYAQWPFIHPFERLI
jgi:hypothetical protein